METRPKIKLTLSKTDKLLEGVSILALLVLWIITIYSYINLPQTIPSHFNALGQIDHYGNKESLLYLAITVTFLYALLTFINNYPYIFNYSRSISVENAKKQYENATRMIRILKVVLVIIFLDLTYMSYLTAIGKAKGLDVWFLPAAITLFSVPVIYAVLRSLRIK